jgi:aminopeptidase N
VLANGRLAGKSAQGGQQTWSYHHPGPMASYLASIQVGEFQLDGGSQAQSKSPTGVLIRNAYPAALAAAAEYDLARQGQMLSVFTKLFGAYPFDVYGTAVVAGLPTQGGPGALGVAAEDTAAEDPVRPSFAAQTLGLLDASLIDGRRTNENQVANAVARQWFGAGVTVADWSEYWLSESFAKYGEWLWAEQTGGASAASAAQAAMARLRTLPQDLIVSDPGAQRLLDVRLGLRGACYLQALRQSVGDQDFFQILQVWCNRAQAGTGTTADFVQIIPQVYTVYPLNQFNDDWLYSAALPELGAP